MPRVTFELVVPNAEGLHARPAMAFVDVANRHASAVSVTHGPDTVDGKSVMAMITLGAAQGTPLTITAEGEDADALCAALKRLFDEKFGEE